VRAVFETNLFGVIAVTEALLPLLRRSAAGRIVNLSSGTGSMGRMTDATDYMARLPAFVGYPVTKTALNMLTVQYAKALAAEGRRDQLRAAEQAHEPGEQGRTDRGRQRVRRYRQPDPDTGLVGWRDLHHQPGHRHHAHPVAEGGDQHAGQDPAQHRLPHHPADRADPGPGAGS
jgi:hypothetical protein